MLAKEIIFAVMMKMDKRTLQWSVMLPLVCTWNPWGPGVRPKTWDHGGSWKGGDGGDEYDGGEVDGEGG